MTLMVGESNHRVKWGLTNYGDAVLGGPTGWELGGACLKPNCVDTDQSYGRDTRNTKYALNTFLPNIADDMDNDLPFGSAHGNGAQFLFADGHVGFLPNSIDITVFRNLSTYAGGEVTPSY